MQTRNRSKGGETKMILNVLQVCTLINVFMGSILGFYQSKNHNPGQIFTRWTFKNKMRFFALFLFSTSRVRISLSWLG